MNWKSIFFRGLCLGLLAYAGGLAAASFAPEAREALGATRFPIYLAANLVLAATAGFRFFRPMQWYMAAALVMVLAMAGSLFSAPVPQASGQAGPQIARMAVFAVVYLGLRLTQPRAEEAGAV